MVELYRTPDCQFCDEIQAKLSNLVVAHRVIEVDPDAVDKSKDEITAPYLKMGNQVFDTQNAMMTFLDELEEELSFSRQLSADACFLDPDDPDACI